MNLLSPELQISQFQDNQTYSNTLLLLHTYNPVEILLSDTSIDSNLHKIIMSEFDDEMVKIEAIRRKYFNENLGLAAIERLGFPSCVQGLTLDSSQYLCLAVSSNSNPKPLFLKHHFIPILSNIHFQFLRPLPVF